MTSPHIFDVKKWEHGGHGFKRRTQIFFLLCRKVWIVLVIKHTAMQDNPYLYNLKS
jgi:hypothetical protein